VVTTVPPPAATRCGTAASTARRPAWAGVTTVAGPMDSPAGRLAVLLGPQEEVFALIAM